MTTRLLITLAVTTCLTAVACGDDADNDDPGASASPTTAEAAAVDPACPTLEAGVLTVATSAPAPPPWFVGDDPTNQEGFEAAVMYAVAEQLGFDDAHVEWTAVDAATALAGGDKPFDLAVSQFVIADELDAEVDFTDGYYKLNQALVTRLDSPAINATTIEDVQALVLGVLADTPAIDFLGAHVAPVTEPVVYPDVPAAGAGMAGGEVDAVVLDLPTAFQATTFELEGAAVLAQFPPTGEDGREFGMVLEEGNPLRDCVNDALGTLRDEGVLDGLRQQWLVDIVGAPVFATG